MKNFTIFIIVAFLFNLSAFAGVCPPMGTGCDAGCYLYGGDCEACLDNGYQDVSGFSGNACVQCPTTPATFSTVQDSSDPTDHDELQDCKRSCTTTDVTGSSAVSGKVSCTAQSGNACNNEDASACSATACNANYYLDNGSCPACSSVGNGSFNKSETNKNNSANGCYKDCTINCTSPITPST